MNTNSELEEPDWDAPLAVALTPNALMNTLFATSDSVHTGWETCVEESITIQQTTVVDEISGNHCRLVELEYADQDAPDQTWHDWTVELRLGETYVIAHWREQLSGSPADWDWCGREAESAFISACLLLGRRVRRGLVVDPAPDLPRTPRTRH